MRSIRSYRVERVEIEEHFVPLWVVIARVQVQWTVHDEVVRRFLEEIFVVWLAMAFSWTQNLRGSCLIALQVGRRCHIVSCSVKACDFTGVIESFTLQPFQLWNF